MIPLLPFSHAKIIGNRVPPTTYRGITGVSGEKLRPYATRKLGIATPRKPIGLTANARLLASMEQLGTPARPHLSRSFFVSSSIREIKSPISVSVSSKLFFAGGNGGIAIGPTGQSVGREVFQTSISVCRFSSHHL